MKSRLFPILKSLPLVLPFLIFFFATLYTPKDYDLGWHLAYGEYLVQHHQILDTNIFSTTMQGYHWISSSWFLDGLTYFLFQKFGFISLSILGASVSVGIFYVISRALKLSFVENGIAMFFLYIYLEPELNPSLRGQTVSLLLLALLFLIIRRYEQGNHKILLTLIPLFIIWPNIHTQYFLGFALMAGWFVLDIVRKVFKNQKNTNAPFIFTIIIISFIATFINPRGFEVLTEIARHFNNPSQKAIIEWLPFVKGSFLWKQFLVLNLVIQAVFLWLLYKKRFIQYLPWIGVTLVLMIASWWMRRYAWSFVVVASFLLIPFLQNLKLGKDRVIKGVATLVVVLSLLWTLKVKLPAEDVGGMDWQRFCEETARCTDRSAQFIIDHKLTTNIWTYYGYGGWLIWNYPEIKPSMDGRMPSWVDENRYSAFLEYYNQEQAITDIDQSPWDTVYTIISKPIYRQLSKLVQEKKWKLVYKDNSAAVFVRN